MSDMSDTVTVGDTKVKVKKGDITKEATNAIIIPKNTTLNQSSGQLPKNDVAVTTNGNLDWQKIIHCNNVTSANITSSVKKALKACDQYKLTAASLKGFETEIADLDTQSSAKCILRGIEEYVVDPTSGTGIFTITIVVQDDAACQAYQRFFQKYQVNYHHFTAFGKTIKLIKGDITEQVVNCILNLTNETLDQSRGVSGAILKAAGDEVVKECKHFGKLNTDETVVTKAGNLAAKYIMHIIGPTDVPAYEPVMDMVLLECHRFKIKSLAIPAIGTGMAGIDPEASINAILKNTLNYLASTHIPTLETISIVVFHEPIYNTYLKVFQAKCTELQESKLEDNIVAALQRQVTISFPSTWTNPGSCGHQEVVLAKNSTEFKVVADDFLSTSGGSYEVVEIARIQNVKLWQSFSLNKQDMDQKYPGQRNVRYLYHGTSKENIANINRRGFNRIYCGENGTAQEMGTYLAVKSDYSCYDRYSDPDSQGHKRVYRAMVITGKYCPGDHACKEPSHINDSEDHFDFVVDNLFHDGHAYPEYLITFKPTSP
ncbi:protein mono-ADP-ribosyltransferase PARP15-like [Hyperolius riggenbachi]|uniref:protein mono-ADP-ribosyltransferase PARP15-like n=1 Tax=Hyperolius riggenbachi TaxID=752182 RepID=UPI0035A39151